MISVVFVLFSITKSQEISIHDLKPLQFDVPNDAIVCPLGSIWLSNSRTMYFVLRNAPMTMDNLKGTIAAFRNVAKELPVGLVVEVTKVAPLNGEMMDYLAPELKPLFSYICIVSKSELATLVVNTFFHFKKFAFPIRMFSDETVAAEWLRQLHAEKQ